VREAAILRKSKGRLAESPFCSRPRHGIRKGETICREVVAALLPVCISPTWVIEQRHRENSIKSYREYLTFNVPKRMDFINITPQVEAAVNKSGIREGLVLVNAMHATLHR
jgi:hypothetical protein